MDKTFRPWEVDQLQLFPPSVKELVPPGHLAHFVRDTVREALDLSAILETYTERRGQPPYHPALMVALLLYSYSRGLYSSRRIEIACEERVDFMAVTAGAKPDHSTIAEFRARHLEALCDLFVQVLALCREAGMVKLGHVAIDGTKMKANASRRQAMSYKRMKEEEPKLAAMVAEWLEKSTSVDEEEDERYGKDKRGDELPDHILAKVKKLAKMRESMARIEAEAEERARKLAEERAQKEKKAGRKLGGHPPKAMDGKPEDKAQSNFTDPESRIMMTGDGYAQAYTGIIAVDAEHQVVVSHDVTNRQSEVKDLIPQLDQIKENVGAYPEEISADCGCCSEENLAALEPRKIRGYVATGRQRHGTPSATNDRDATRRPYTRAMRTRLRLAGYRSRYRLRKQVVEPAFGQLKEARGFRRFLMRGLEKVKREWGMLWTAHNLLKLYRYTG